MRQQLLNAMVKLNVTQAELLERINSIADEKTSKQYKNNNTKYKGITRMTLYNILYKDTGITDRTAELILVAINSFVKQKNIRDIEQERIENKRRKKIGIKKGIHIYKIYDYDSLDINVTNKFKYKINIPYILCSKCGYCFDTISIFNQHYIRGNCLNKDDMLSLGFICEETVLHIIIHKHSSTVTVSKWKKEKNMV